MSKNGWTPKIVGGTDLGDGGMMPANDIAVMLPKETETERGVIMTTHEELSDYANTIPSDLRVTWDYGVVQSVRDGQRLQHGQYVTEIHDGVEHQKYWVSN